VITSVDTNALLALLYDDDYTDKSETELRRAYRDGRVVITSIVYAELSADGHFDSTSELNQFLEDFSIRLLSHRKKHFSKLAKDFSDILPADQMGFSVHLAGQSRLFSVKNVVKILHHASILLQTSLLVGTRLPIVMRWSALIQLSTRHISHH